MNNEQIKKEMESILNKPLRPEVFDYLIDEIDGILDDGTYSLYDAAQYCLETLNDNGDLNEVLS